MQKEERPYQAVQQVYHPEFISESRRSEKEVEILKRVQHDITEVGGFTLVELLVVVLIIGILAAVALPQYQKAVIKTRYATLKNLVHSIDSAEQIYFMENGKYTNKFSELSIDAGGEQKDEYDAQRYFPWGFCSIVTDEGNEYAYCKNTTINLGYVVSFGTHKRVCHIYKNTPLLQSICKQETNGATPEGGGDSQSFTYP